MSQRQFDTEAPVAAKADPVRETAAPDSEITAAADYAAHFPGALRTGSVPRQEAQAAALAQASGGQLARAGGALLQLQRDYGNRYVQRVVNHARQADSSNHTGLPDQLKASIESLSGISMNNVKVHYNSAQPAQLNALAYTQGSDIHVAPGQERHLPHEVWHVVQQAQGRVKPTMQMEAGVAINDDESLEHEADVIGAKARVTVARERQQGKSNNDIPFEADHQPIQKMSSVVQLGGKKEKKHFWYRNVGLNIPWTYLGEFGSHAEAEKYRREQGYTDAAGYDFGQGTTKKKYR